MRARRSDVGGAIARRRCATKRRALRPNELGASRIRRPPRNTSPTCRRVKCRRKRPARSRCNWPTATSKARSPGRKNFRQGAARQNALTNIISQWSEADPQAAADFALQRDVKQKGAKLCSRTSRDNGHATIRKPRCVGPASLTEKQWARRWFCPALSRSLPNPIRARRRDWSRRCHRAKRKAARRRRSPGNGRAKIRKPRASGRHLFRKAKSRERAFESLMNRWSQNDPYAAGAWLGTLPAGNRAMQR